MSKDPSGYTLQKHTLMLFEGDFQRLAELFPSTPPSVIVRKLVRDIINKVEARPTETESTDGNT